MNRGIAKEIETYLSHIKALKAIFDVEEVCPLGFTLAPKEEQSSDKYFGKPVALTLTGIIHGNELAGIGIINGLLALLRGGSIRLDYRLGIALGNISAANQNVRFVECDLNRSFGIKDPVYLEQKRARELELLLGQSYYYVDFHQTTKKSPWPFFIFPFTAESFQFARDIAPQWAVVTHWGDSFSTEGMCSDEYVNQHGGVGITCEMGENGFDTYQISAGLDIALSAIQLVGAKLMKPGYQSIDRKGQFEVLGEIFTWAQIVPWPEGADSQVLDEGWYNFKEVEKGSRLGTVNGQCIYAETSGWMIFPKYLHPGETLKSKPTELLRIMKKISEDELPK